MRSIRHLPGLVRGFAQVAKRPRLDLDEVEVLRGAEDATGAEGPQDSDADGEAGSLQLQSCA